MDKIEEDISRGVDNARSNVKTMERLWNGNYKRVWSANFMLFFSFMLLTPLLPLYLSEEFGADRQDIGLVLSGYTVATLVVRAFSGYIVDSFPRKAVLMITYFFVCSVLCRVYRGWHVSAIYHSAHSAWIALWRSDRGQQHGGHRCAADIAAQRRHRILWTKQ